MTLSICIRTTGVRDHRSCCAKAKNEDTLVSVSFRVGPPPRKPALSHRGKSGDGEMVTQTRVPTIRGKTSA